MTRFDFLGKAKFFAGLSALLFTASILVLVTIGLRPGIDFTGGLQLTVFYSPGTDLSNDAIRGYVEPLLAGTSPAPSLYIQTVDGQRDIPNQGMTPVPGKIVTIQGATDEQEDQLRLALTEPAADSGIPRPIEFSVTDIGAQVSREIVNRAWQAILIALGAMMVYIAWRFRLRYGVAAVVALIHDVVITLGVFAVARLELNLPVIAGLLTVVGYSLNATIIIFDRVRENVRTARKASLAENINRAIEQTLTRTINTGATTLIPIIILFVFGGPPLRGFAVAMLMGVIAGTHSSLFVSNPIVYGWSLAADRARARRR
ncbi:MAG: Protein translocase subunit SecF [Candidatus Bipolaricaulis sibiricus]|uniref:Protein-export membrane protein SecF n=1 Tax=Bipolaricaulis sibiricus TaxID=2501609 RepID=A0A410FWM2_BIPS1|nr:MAG: Protein translocase subunit SecF [Candidatus Bipolaricaulis sibiricus]